MVLIGMLELLCGHPLMNSTCSFAYLTCYFVRLAFFLLTKRGLPCDKIDSSESPLILFVFSSDPHACLKLHPFMVLWALLQKLMLIVKFLFTHLHPIL